MTTVCIIAGYASIRAGLYALLTDAPDLAVVEAVEGVGENLACLLAERRPDALLLDTSGDGETDSVLDLLELLSPLARRPAVVILGERPEGDLPRLAEADLPGWAYLLRETDGPQIVQATVAAASGLISLDRSLAWSLLGGGTASEARSTAASDLPDFPGDTLTPREIEVLELMAEGLPNKIIASRLKISLHTAKFHVAQILGKLDATSRTEAVTIGARRGYVTL